MIKRFSSHVGARSKTASNSNGRRARLRSSLVTPAFKAASPPVLITGGAGFVGTNVADYFLSIGQPVLLLDNFSRSGVERNVAWLRKKHGDLVRVQQGDLQDFPLLRRAVRGVSKVFHFGAQVAVTTSLEQPFLDFEVNARGTLNLLEALRELAEPPPLIFTSTNKVYGDLSDVPLRAGKSRYRPMSDPVRTHGFGEARPLDFHSPYGCSKGAAEQYVLDYARTFQLPAVVFRMSCIYGPHQFGTEDQGWVAHFLIRALERRPITVYGDGKQVRDILYIDDLVQAFLLAHQHMRAIAGQAFNIGGGPDHTISLLELVELISELEGVRPLVRFDEWRTADQQYYVSDIRKFSAATGWSPKVDVRSGLNRLCEWLRQSQKTPAPILLPTEEIADDLAPLVDAAPVAKLPSNGVALSTAARETKRVWKLDAASPSQLEGKIIKFP